MSELLESGFFMLQTLFERMLPWFDVWPWNLPPGTAFLKVYLVAGALLFVATTVVRTILAARIDASHRVRWEGGSRSHAGSSVAPGAALVGAIGPAQLPSGEGLWVYAWMKGRAPAVVDALLAAAGAAGFWQAPAVSSYDAVWTLHDKKLQSDDPLLADFGRRLSGRSPTARMLVETARETVAANQYRIEAQLHALGLVRTLGDRLSLAVVPFFALGLLIVGGLMRAWVREHISGETAPFPLWLLMAMMGFTALFLFQMTATRPPRHAREYVAWVKRVTTSLRKDVVAGRRSDPRDAAITAACVGLAGLGTFAAFHTLRSALSAPAPVSSSWSSSSSCSSTWSSGSSCSSSTVSSCGGGGGCGSSCGGGGGCS
jgi:uncharacterized membrane protein YgcG